MQTIYIQVIDNYIRNWAYEPIGDINIQIEVSEDDLDKINNSRQLCSYEDGKFYFNAKKQSDEILAALKKEKIEILNQNYAKSLILDIKNGFSFQLDLRSKDGERLLEIINNSIGSYQDIVLGKKIVSFFINIEDGLGESQVTCNCLNWIWQYIFEELITYVKSTKQLKENITVSINKSSADELEIMKYDFPKPSGIKIDISATIQKLLLMTGDINLDGSAITIPEYVKFAIRQVNRELFKYSKKEQIEKDILLVLNKSWFQ